MTGSAAAVITAALIADTATASRKTTVRTAETVATTVTGAKHAICTFSVLQIMIATVLTAKLVFPGEAQYKKAAVEIPATGTPTDPTPENPDSPPTGDNSMMALWIAVLFVSGFGVVTTAVYGKKRHSVK